MVAVLFYYVIRSFSFYHLHLSTLTLTGHGYGTVPFLMALYLIIFFNHIFLLAFFYPVFFHIFYSSYLIILFIYLCAAQYMYVGTYLQYFYGTYTFLFSMI